MATANQKNSKSIQIGDLKSQFAAALSKQKPWDSISDFVTHPSFCGYKPYPKQLTLLKLIYLETENMTAFDLEVIDKWREGFGGTTSTGVQSDIWDRVKYLKENGYRRFPHIQSVLGRRASKGWIGGILGAETMAYMISLDNWQEHYGIQEHKDGYMHALATNIYQAKKFQFADIRDAVSACAYLTPFVSDSKDHLLHLRTPADIRYIAQLKGRGIAFDHEIATIRCLAMTTASASGRGGTTFCLDPDTPIALADHSQKRIADVNVGDSLLGVEESGQNLPVETTVVAKNRRTAKALKIYFEDGTFVICSRDHRWLDEFGIWREAGDFKVGDKIAEFKEIMDSL